MNRYERSMGSISQAVVLMAGSGSRLRSAGTTLPKLLVQLSGRPLISYTLEALVRAGIKVVYAIVGFESDLIINEVNRLAPSQLQVRFINNADWKKQNGISVLAAADHVSSPFLLTMGDHLFEQSIVDLLLRRAQSAELNVAIDRKLNSIFDLNDAMKVHTRGDCIIGIGKDLKIYDAVDTGIFLCGAEIFRYLEKAKVNADCTLADGVRLMAAEGKVRAIDIGNAWWQDIDNPEMLAHAENHLRTKLRRTDIASLTAEPVACDPSQN